MSVHSPTNSGNPSLVVGQWTGYLYGLTSLKSESKVHLGLQRPSCDTFSSKLQEFLMRPSVPIDAARIHFRSFYFLNPICLLPHSGLVLRQLPVQGDRVYIAEPPTGWKGSTLGRTETDSSITRRSRPGFCGRRSSPAATATGCKLPCGSDGVTSARLRARP